MMDSCQEILAKARKDLQVAEQMLIKTYPVVEDPKLILAILQDIYIALIGAMRAFLTFKGIKHDLISGDTDDIDAAFEVFGKNARASGFKDDDIELIAKLHKIIREHKESPVEFARKDKFVICDEHYNCDVISVDDMKKYLFRARLFVDKTEETISGEQGVKDE
ncbi:MAG: hypothetical protein V1729_02735 [Candidatus Woesearchaeota archaeon]